MGTVAEELLRIELWDLQEKSIHVESISIHPLDFVNEKVAFASLSGIVTMTWNSCQELLRQYELLRTITKFAREG